MDTDEVDIITDLLRVTKIDVNACQHLLVLSLNSFNNALLAFQKIQTKYEAVE